MKATYLPAAPGFYVLSVRKPRKDRYELVKLPITGWKIVQDEMTVPMTMAGVHKIGTTILAPNGEVSNGHDSYTSIDRWIDLKVPPIYTKE